MTEPLIAQPYIRVSTKEQAESGLSLAAQERKCQLAIDLKDWQAAAPIVDDGESAATLDRPGMRDLLARVDRGQVDVIVIVKLDRLTRSIRDLWALLDRLKATKRAAGDGQPVDLFSAHENLETHTATGRLVINILGAVAQWERELISERTAAAMAELKRQGRATGGQPPFGYSAGKDGRLIEAPGEVEIIERARQLREVEGLAWTAIAAQLTAEGYRTRTGNEFSRQGISALARKMGIA